MTDVSLVDFIGVKGKHAVFLPHTAGRYQSRPFRKTQCPIVERLVNSMMMHGRNNGKKLSVNCYTSSNHTDGSHSNDDSIDCDAGTLCVRVHAC